VDNEGFAQWCILEIMGHRRLAGRVTERTIAGKGFLQVDIPTASGKPVTQIYGPDSVYCITPTEESVAREIAPQLIVLPIHQFSLDAMWKVRQLQLCTADADGLAVQAEDPIDALSATRCGWCDEEAGEDLQACSTCGDMCCDVCLDADGRCPGCADTIAEQEQDGGDDDDAAENEGDVRAVAICARCGETARLDVCLQCGLACCDQCMAEGLCQDCRDENQGALGKGHDYARD